MTDGKAPAVRSLCRRGFYAAAICVVASSVSLGPSPVDAAVIRIPESAFSPGSGLITFSEFPLGTVNPTYAPADYGGDPVTSPTVTFDGYFLGQMLSVSPGVDCPGGAATACVVGAPTDPLALDAAAPRTFITPDAASPTPPVLSGSPRFAGPIAIHFDIDMAGVGLDGGFFAAAGSTAITAFARDGSVLGSTINEGTRIEFLGLVTEDGTDQIAGLLFSTVGDEPAGFSIDNLRFGTQDEVVVPVPAALPLFASGLVGLGILARRRLKAT